MKRLLLALAAIGFVVLMLPLAHVRGQNEVLATKFRRVGRSIPNQYIVVFKDDIPDDDIESLANNLAALNLRTPKATYRYALKGFSIHDISETQAIALSNDPRVEFVEENCLGTTGSIQNIDYSLPHAAWHLDRIDQTNPVPQGGSGAGTYTYNQTGTGVHAYVLDTGILSAHTEFGGRVVFGADYGATDPTFHPVLDGSDCEVIDGFNQGHGTQVAGALGAATYGVAKNVTIHNIRVCNCDRTCPADVITQGVDWVTGQHIKPAVANMSLQLPSISTAVEKAIKKSIAGGVIYVVIAGNRGNDPDPLARDAGNFTPSRISQAITVASTTRADSRELTSSTGSVVDLFSPGENTPSPIRTGTSDINDFFRGTSSAAPKVAGAAAMYLETDPTACPCTVGRVLTDNSTGGAISDYDPNGFGTPNKFLYVPSSWPTPTYYSLSLNGTSRYVQVATDSGAVGLNITDWITLEAWIKLNANNVEQGIIERYSASDGGYALRVTNQGKLQFSTLINSSNLDSVTGSITLQTGQWYHVAGVWGGLTMRVYVNGQLDTSKSSTFAPGSGTSPLYIGRRASGGGYFNGLIDEARVTATWVYNSNFTPEHRLTGTFKTKALWRFDDQTAKDCGGFNDGSLIGGAVFSTDVP